MTTVLQETKEGVRHTLHVMDATGDTRTTWAPGSAEEIAAAREIFDRLKNEMGYLAYTAPTDGSTGEVIHTFDPQAQAIVMSPQMVGG